MPELPEVQAHAERLTHDFAGRVLVRFKPLTFTALKTALPAPDDAYGEALRAVARRRKHLQKEALRRVGKLGRAKTPRLRGPKR